MLESKHLRKHVFVRMSFAAVCLIVAADRVGAESVTITNYWNNKTRDAVKFNANVNDLIIFRVKANQDIDTWHWFLNGKKTGLFR